MSAPTPTHRGADPQERALRRSWWLFAGSFFVLGLIVLLRLGSSFARPIDLPIAGLVVLVGYAAILHRNAVHQLEMGRRAEAESFARILQGLSRSVSPDAIVDAIVEELGMGTGADHIVVVRRHPDAAGLAATLVSSRPGVPNAATLFPLSDLEDPLADAPRGREPVAVPVGGVGAAAAVGVSPGIPALARVDPLARVAPTDGVAPASLVAATVAVAAVPVVGSGEPAMGPISHPPSGRLGVAVASLAARARGGVWRLALAAPGPSVHVDPASRPSAAASAAQRVAERIADRTREVYGLRNTLAAPLRTEDGVIGAIIVSRRLPDPWPAAARRILRGAAVEASAALARATNHRDAEARATTDALTGLPNRRYFDEFCGLLARRRRTDDAVGVLLIDIDRFKYVNDSFGHAAGDEVLRRVATAIAGAVREGDVPARFGGEEFAVLLRNPSRAVAIDVAERVRAAVGRVDLRRFGPPGVTVSVGVAVASAPDQPIRDLVAAADYALYEAKRTGRDRVVAAG